MNKNVSQKSLLLLPVVFLACGVVHAESDNYTTAREAAKYRQDKLMSEQIRNSTNPTERAHAERRLETYRNMPENLKDALIEYSYREAAKK